MPAEWEPHEATWIAWPHNRSDWPGKFAPIPWAYCELTRKLATAEPVRILVQSHDHEISAIRKLEKVGVDPEYIEFFHHPTNRSWTRDFAPIFIQRRSQNKPIAILNFGFNAWAKYQNWQKDNVIPSSLAQDLNLPTYDVIQENRPVILEGGSIEVNGSGTLLTTEECLLDQNTQVRNPGFTHKDYERIFHDSLGVHHTLWLGQGIAGDDTHGHVDDLCRFVAPDTVVLCQETNPHDANYKPLCENKERLQDATLADGSNLKVINLPMPEPLYFEGIRLPASYANFYIANAAMLVPVFNDKNDYIALGILSELISDRPVIGIYAGDLVWGFGTLHCLTQQQPAPP